ncbi:uncharacterized protein DUF559 [Rhizobium sp. PP-CC-3G-465]|nr:uncharacterized protein DUF559 [Rhizobium sp. PP-CC-3G-465]
MVTAMRPTREKNTISAATPFMMQQGFTVLRFDNDQIVGNSDHVTLLIESKIAERLAEVGAS